MIPATVQVPRESAGVGRGAPGRGEKKGRNERTNREYQTPSISAGGKSETMGGMNDEK